MRCKWCGAETPDDSAFCLNCGRAQVAAEPRGTGERAPEPAAAGSGVAADFEISLDDDFDPAPPWPLYKGKPFQARVPAFVERLDSEPLVEAPTPPVAPQLGGAYVAAIAVIGALFAVAVILLGCIVLLRALGI